MREIRNSTEYIRSMSREQLTIMKQGDNNKDWKLESDTVFVQGLGGGELKLRGTISFSLYGNDRERCIAVQSIEGEIITSPQIHIASNYPKGSCEYNAILEHEEKHVRVLRDFAREYKPRFAAQLRRLAEKAGADGPMPRAQMKPAQARKHEIIAGGITSYGQTIMRLLQQRQFALDTSSEYARIHAQCDNWQSPMNISPQKQRYNR